MRIVFESINDLSHIKETPESILFFQQAFFGGFCFTHCFVPRKDGLQRSKARKGLPMDAVNINRGHNA